MKQLPQIPQSSFDFLNALKQNNNREWFNLHKAQFEKEQGHLQIFAEALLQKMNMHDLIETVSGKKSLYRIYRDTRFSSDKTPYKIHWPGSFKRATKYRRGGYYFHIEPGNSFIGGGFWGPNPQDLKLIREDIAFDATPLRNILNDPTFISVFETLKGEQLKTTPKGFDAGHEAIDLLRYKQFLLMKRFTDAEVLDPLFVDQVNSTFKNMRPFLDYMSEVLSTDVNGLAIY
ncbi:TIGR02453 family protein [Mucilaginibacter sp. OK268]|jgi:uncharacterized protein (TIGR02453 family)|uniref:DUF2461 domain-containing protein n=1 Tax=Mucilaginibacter sp. OK268 TaxID=1881048 RepID=UPI00088C0788|nr:DUF2461 domain-containing protein [Mucilaginibacter sp. OK268]SDP97932.1 TIGR02453 family protein [Mucilaginibacter sp. OK268]